MAKAIRVFQTAQETDDRLKELDALAFGPVPDYTCQWVIADPAYRFQTIEGFGGAFTEALPKARAHSPSIGGQTLPANLIIYEIRLTQYWIRYGRFSRNIGG